MLFSVILIKRSRFIMRDPFKYVDGILYLQ
ncbi:laccase, partial [Bacillus thuringiensis]|nr:laccase [Bacillus thuringiensis]